MNTVAWITSDGEQHDIKDIEARRTKLNIEDLPKNVAFFINDAGYITNAVNDLVNYYKKSETYTKAQIDAIVTPKLAIEIVNELPTQDISTTTIYFLRRNRPSGTTQYESDVYDEYIYVNGTWELIGNTYVDLSDYYTKSETNTQIQTQIGVESQARQDADGLLQTNINNVQTNLNLTNQNLNAEISAREVKNLQHENDISANATAIQAERTRAMGAESTLSDRCNTYDSHLANTNNPHSVTKAQVGLGNVTNVATTDTITNNSNQNITSGAVYTGLAGKVDKVTGKGLSDENYTYAEKTKLAGLSNYNDTALKNRVTATENAITTLNGNSSVNGSVDKKIADAIGGIIQIDFQIVQTLPATGVKGVIYFVVDTLRQENVYNEYVWVNNSWELIGQTLSKIDLSDYYKKAETNALVSVKNDKITVSNDTTALTDSDSFDETSAGTNPTSIKRRLLSSLWTYINSKISSVLGLTSSSYSGTSTYATNLGTSSANYTKSSLDTALSGKVATTRKVNGHALSSDVTVTKSDVGLSNVDNTADSNKAVASAGKLTTARKVYVKLGTASTTETKDFSGVTEIPVSGTLGAGNGGTGKTSLKDSANALINSLEVGTMAPADDTNIIIEGTYAPYKEIYYKKPMSLLWNYIKAKFSVTTSGSGNAITGLSYSGGVFTATKGSTFLTSHQNISGKANLTIIAPAFSTSTAYAVGSFVTYNQLLYKCTTAHSAGAWDANHFTQVTVTASITKENVGLGNVGNFKAVSTVASQGLSATEKSNARANIGAGTSSFSGSYTDLTNKPTIPDAQVQADWSETDNTSKAFIKNKPTNPSSITVDSTLSSTSTNPVQNKVINTALGNKVDKVSGKGLSTNDFTTTDKNAIRYYGTCDTSRATNAKVVTCANFVLEIGCRIIVKFTDTAGSAPTSGNITLNINSTGAKNVYNKNYAQMTYANSGEFRNNRYCEFTYDGTNFIWLNVDTNTTYSVITQAEIIAGTVTNPKLVTPKVLADNFVRKESIVTCNTIASAQIKEIATNSPLTTKDKLFIIFTNGNIANDIKLKVNDGTVYPLVYSDSICSINCFSAGSIVEVVFTGSQYQILNADRYYDLQTPTGVYFGKEYLGRVSSSILYGASLKIVLAGDSTFAMNNGIVGSCPEYIAKCFAKAGANFSLVNNAVSGQSVNDWIANCVNNEIAENPNLYIIRIGFNNNALSGTTWTIAKAIEDYETRMRYALNKIRTSLALDVCSVVLMSPSTSNDTPNNRDYVIRQLQSLVLRKLAREFQCGFFDTYKCMQDATPDNNMFDDPYGDGRHIHPTKYWNLYMISELCDFLIPSVLMNNGVLAQANSNILTGGEHIIGTMMDKPLYACYGLLGTAPNGATSKWYDLSTIGVTGKIHQIKTASGELYINPDYSILIPCYSSSEYIGIHQVRKANDANQIELDFSYNRNGFLIYLYVEYTKV